MLESKPPRNSLLETHPHDEWGRKLQSERLHRMERFPYASKNSYGKSPRSGILFLELGFERHRSQVAQRRVQALAVVHLVDEVRQAGADFVPVAIPVQIHLLALQRFHKAFGLGIVVRIAGAAHADPESGRFQQRHVVLGSVLHAAIGMMRRVQWPAGPAHARAPPRPGGPPMYRPTPSPPPCASTRPESPPDTRTSRAAGCR